MDGGSGRGTDPTRRAFPWAVRRWRLLEIPHTPLPVLRPGALRAAAWALPLPGTPSQVPQRGWGRRAQAGLPPGPVEKAGDPWEDTRPIQALSTISPGPEVSCTAKPKEPLNLVQSSDIRGEITHGEVRVSDTVGQWGSGRSSLGPALLSDPPSPRTTCVAPEERAGWAPPC